jgi:hypothetical protein
MHRRTLLLSALFALATSHLHAQSMPGMDMPAKPQPATPAMNMNMPMPQPTTLIDNELQHTTSGTTIEPASTPASMLMTEHGSWTLMLHGTASISDIQQHADNERGGDKLFSTNWIMPMAQRKLGTRGLLTLRTMLSLEPATITGRFYPELFQQGETAYGRAIVDGQHPHDLFMEIALLYDLRLGNHALLSLYAAPVGDPAIGPTAYPHRHSASEDPIAALGHHQQDSTHIAFNVLTAGITYKTLRLEASGFHGAEPTESRWQPEPSPNGHAIDSYSSRLTWTPTPNLAAQYSIAQITSPEALTPGVNQRRQTASVMYNRSFGAHQSMSGMSMPGDHPATGNWSNTLLWGQTRASTTGALENSYLLESLLQLRTRNYLWTRIEVAARTSELLDAPGPTSGPETVLGHVQAYTLGYDRDYRIAPHLLAAPGAQFTLYRTPDSLASTYGRDPFSAVAFVRLRLAH